MYISTMKNYNSLTQWRNENTSEYNKAYRKGWLDDICEANNWVKLIEPKPYKYWTKERCIEEAKKYKTNSEWQKNNPSCVSTATRQGWVDEIRELNGFHVLKKWTRSGCIKEARKYNSLSEWQRKSNGSKKSAKRNGWYEECTKHMK